MRAWHLGGVLGRVARAGLGLVRGLVARAHDQGLRSGRVRHVIEVEAADPFAPQGSLLTARMSRPLKVTTCAPSPW